MTFKRIEHFRVIFHAAKDYVIVPAALSIFDRNDITLHRVTLLRINEPINDLRPLRCSGYVLTTQANRIPRGTNFVRTSRD